MSGEREVRELEKLPGPPEGLIRFLRRAIEEAKRTGAALAPFTEYVVVGTRRRWWSWRRRPVMLRASWRLWGDRAVLWIAYDKRTLGSIVCDRRLGTFLPIPLGGEAGQPRRMLVSAIAALVIGAGHGRAILTAHVQQLAAQVRGQLWKERHSVSDGHNVSSPHESAGHSTAAGEP